MPRFCFVRIVAVNYAHMNEQGFEKSPEVKKQIEPTRNSWVNRFLSGGFVQFFADRALKPRANWMIGEVSFKDVMQASPNELVMGEKGGIEEEKNTQKVLCIGAGKGHEMEVILNEFSDMKVVGVDPHDNISPTVEKRLEAGKKDFEYLHETVHAGDLKEIADNSMDVATLFFVLHHIDTGEYDQVMSELKRVLKIDGKVFIAEDLVDSKEEQAVTETIDRKLNFEVLNHGPHNYKNTDAWKQFFKEHGFRMIKSKETKPDKVRHGWFVLERIHGEYI